MLDFPITDPHVHLWDPRTTPRAVTPLVKALGAWPDLCARAGTALFPRALIEFVGRPDHVLRAHLPDDYARGTRGAPSDVDTLVHVQAGWEEPGPLGPVGETRWLDALEQRGVRIGAIVGHVDLTGSDVDGVLDAHVATSARFRGVRHMAAHHPSAWVHSWTNLPHLYASPQFLRGFERLAVRGLRFDAWVYGHQLGDVAALAARFPDVPIVLDHLGTPVGALGAVGDVGLSVPERTEIVARWRDDLAAVASHRNVHAKLSGLAMPVVGGGFHRWSTPPTADELADAFAPLLGHALDVFGTERAFFASNFPMDKVAASFATIFDAYERIARARGEATLRPLFRDNAWRFYGL